MPKEPLLSVEDVAKRLNVSVRSVQRWIRYGKFLTPIRLGRQLRWDAQKVEDWIAEGCPAPTQHKPLSPKKWRR